MLRLRTPVLALFLLSFTGCVSRTTYDEAVASEDRTIAALRVEHARDVEALRVANEASARALASNKQLETDVSGLTARSSELAVNLWVTRAQRDLLTRLKNSAERRAALYQDLATKLQRMIDSGDVHVLVRDGRMVIALPTDVLFDSGQVDIKPHGRASLAEVAAVLKTLEGRHLQVAGHTDNVPMATARFASNWELSSGRAIEVVRFLIKQGIDPRVLSAAGYGEFDPVASNDAVDGRGKNRRIEITLMPELDEAALP